MKGIGVSPDLETWIDITPFDQMDVHMEKDVPCAAWVGPFDTAEPCDAPAEWLARVQHNKCGCLRTMTLCPGHKEELDLLWGCTDHVLRSKLIILYLDRL